MKEGLKKQVIDGLMWTYFERIAAHLVSVTVTVILARILSPVEYGIISIVTIFTELANVIVINGLGTALIQKKNSASKDFSTIFYANIVITVGLYIVLFVFAPVIESFYGIGQLTEVLRVLGLQMPIAGINAVQQAYISKSMAFKKFFFSTLTGTLVSAIVGIVLAFHGFGVWALVAQLLTNRIVDTIVLSFVSGWELTKEFSWMAFKELISYSWKISASSFLIVLWDNIRVLIIGKKYSTEDLAYYDRGRQFPSVIASNINTSISKVLFPALSNVQNEKERVCLMTRRTIKEGTYFLMPLLFGLAACGHSFVVVFLTEKWSAVVPYLQVMCFVYALQPIQTASIQAIKAIGRSDIYLKLEVIKKFFHFTILFITLFAFNNVLIVAVGALISELISTLFNFPVNKKLFGYNYKDQFDDLLATFLMSIIMFMCVFATGAFIDSPFFALIVQIILGCVVYLALSVIFRVESFEYTVCTIKEMFARRKK